MTVREENHNEIRIKTIKYRKSDERKTQRNSVVYEETATFAVRHKELGSFVRL